MVLDGYISAPPWLSFLTSHRLIDRPLSSAGTSFDQLSLFFPRSGSVDFIMAKCVLGLLLGLVVALALLAAGATASSRYDLKQNVIPTCTTGENSPSQGDANAAIQYIRSLGNRDCEQRNCNGDKCTTMWTTGSARVKICGGCNKSVKCVTAGDALNQVLADCVRNVNGQALVSGNNDVEGLTVVLEGTSNRIGSELTCTTGENSPSQGDANNAIQYIRNLGNRDCEQRSCSGDKCTTVWTSGSARVKICGDCQKSVKCVTAGDALNEVLAQCVRNVNGEALVSGKNDVEGLTVVLEETSNKIKSEAACTTGENSPSQADSNTVVQNIRNMGNRACEQRNCNGDKCTTLFESGSARARICGDCSKSVKCVTAGDSLNEVLAQCVRNVNGKALVSGENDVEGLTVILEETSNKIKSEASCTTGENSPSQGDANTVVQYIRNLGNRACEQKNCNGDKCTTLYESGSARARLCGDCSKSLKCVTAGDSLNEVLAQCVRNVNGQALVSGENDVEGLTVVLEETSNKIKSEASCTTGENSPSQGDANTVVQYIRNLGNRDCEQRNCNGDKCTTMWQSGSARARICGDCNKSLKCVTAGDALNEVLAQCVRNVNGQALVSGENDVEGLTVVLEETSNKIKSEASCTTGENSPSQGDANNVVQYIRNLGNRDCEQRNCNGDKCTTMWQSGSARARICGDCNKGLKCVTAGNALNEVLAQCVRNVNGKALVSGENDVEGLTVVLEETSNNIRMVSDE